MPAKPRSQPAVRLDSFFDSTKALGDVPDNLSALAFLAGDTGVRLDIFRLAAADIDSSNRIRAHGAGR